MNLLKLILVRHAQSIGNANAQWPSRADDRLTEAGRRQAVRLRLRLQRESPEPTHIYSSPIGRALETARIASSAWDQRIETWEDLAENNVGVFSGLTWAEVEDRFPQVARAFTDNWSLDVVDGAETHAQRTARAQRVVDRVVREHGNADRVLLFSHGGIMTHIIGRVLGTDRLWSFGMRNTAIFEFDIDADSWHERGQSRVTPGLWRINRFGDASHLDGLT